jgi:hypothetical protein
MKQYFNVTIRVEKESEDAKGRPKVKVVRELYIVDAVNPTEAEAKIHTHLKGSTEEFEVVSITLNKVIEIIE